MTIAPPSQPCHPRTKPPIVDKTSETGYQTIQEVSTSHGYAAPVLDDGRVEIDSNTVERSIRPLALTRKNALFAGSDAGARHWAVIATLIETCKLNGVDPQAYLTDVITRIVQAHPDRDIDDLMPWRFKTAEPDLAAVA